MLLANLETDKEKEAFLNLASLLTKASGCIGYSEKRLLNLYLKEIGVTIQEYQPKPGSIAEFCHAFSSPSSQNTVFMNLYALARAEGCENPEQLTTLAQIQHELGISTETAEQCQTWLDIVKGNRSPAYID